MNAPPDPDDLNLSGAADVVLVVDDVPENIALLNDALDEAGYTVLVATGGEAALQLAHRALPDIVLLDAVMPGLDGFEVARRLKADASTAGIPIVFMTGLTETEHVVAAFAAGGTDYVTKPIKPREVLARIAAHLQAARTQRQARNALDAFGHATMVVRERATAACVWQTALARKPAARTTSVAPRQRRRPCRDRLAGAPKAAAPPRGELPQPLVSLPAAGGGALALHAMTGDAGIERCPRKRGRRRQ
jgi:DNA-binding response OmpR family regulator